MAKTKIEKAFETRAALMRLRDEIDKQGGFSDYAQFCEEMLDEIIPYLSPRGMKIVKDSALRNCRLDTTQ